MSSDPVREDQRGMKVIGRACDYGTEHPGMRVTEESVTHVMTGQDLPDSGHNRLFVRTGLYVAAGARAERTPDST
jgi:hypothetical protein